MAECIGNFLAAWENQALASSITHDMFEMVCRLVIVLSLRQCHCALFIKLSPIAPSSNVRMKSLFRWLRLPLLREVDGEST